MVYLCCFLSIIITVLGTMLYREKKDHNDTKKIAALVIEENYNLLKEKNK